MCCGAAFRYSIACGALRDAALLPRYEQVLAPDGATPASGQRAGSVLPSDAIAVALKRHWQPFVQKRWWFPFLPISFFHRKNSSS